MTMWSRYLPWFVPLVSVLLLLAACNGSSDEVVDATVATTTTAAATTTTVAPTTTTVAPATTTTTAAQAIADGDLAAGWFVVEDSAVFGGAGRQAMRDVAASADVSVAVGAAQGDKAVDVGSADAAVWVSSDGVEWTRVGADSVFRESAAQSMLAVIVGGPGFVAVGTAEINHQDQPAVWLSQDGYSWDPVDDTSGAFDTHSFAQIWDVAVGGPGLVAVGYSGAPGMFDAAAWVSPDGTVWTRVTDDSFEGDHDEFMTAIATLDDGRLVVVGNDGTNRMPSVWTSSDGVSWQQIDEFGTVDEGSGMAAVAVRGDGLVAVGRDESGDDVDAAVWVSPDGNVWDRVESAAFGGPGDQVMSGVAEIDGAIIAVGYERLTDRDAVVWRSSDGLTWTRSPEGSLAASGFQEMLSLAAADDQLVAVGYSGEIGEWAAAVWRQSP